MFIAALLGTLILQGQAGPPAAGTQIPAVDSKLSKAEQQHQKDIAYDIQLGKRFSVEVEKTEKLSDNKPYQERVNRIGQEMAAIAQTTQVEVFWGDRRLNKFNYTFKVIKGKDQNGRDQVNAFTLPGGIVYVYEGLVAYAESDDEIAAVLGHEISHAEQRHIAQLTHEQQKTVVPSLLALLGAIATRNPDLVEAAILAGQLTTQSFMSTWSIEAEKSADHGGFQYLLHSKYNPTAMLTFMERLSLDEHRDGAGLLDWGIYRTHPPGKDRAEAVLKDMRAFGIPVQRSLVTTRFRTEVKPGKEGVDIWFNKRRLYTFAGSDALQRADEAAGRLNKFFDQEPNLFDIDFDGKEILGRRSPLIDVVEQDAEAERTSTQRLGESAVEAIRGSLYNYAFNIWGAKL